MSPVWQEVSSAVPSAQQMVRVGLRLFAAILVIAAVNAGLQPTGVARVIQGLVTGIGFLGGGTILKLTEEHEIRGLTTAAGIWLTAAASVAAGLGQFWDAFLGVLFALVVLTVVGRIDAHREEPRDHESTDRHRL